MAIKNNVVSPSGALAMFDAKKKISEIRKVGRWLCMPVRLLGLGFIFAVVLAPRAAWACACGCEVLDVATSSMFPDGPGGTVFTEFYNAG